MKPNFRAALLVSVAFSSIITPLSVRAQTGGTGMFEEVVVTAQKRVESVQDVPLSISAVGAEIIESTGADEVDDIILMVPGLSGTSTAGTLNFWAIRGIASTDFTIGSEPSVGVYLNDAYIGRNVLALGAFHDVNRIEVVKGPQGTLFGRNAAAGAISIVSNLPEDANLLKLGAGFGNEGHQVYDVVGNVASTDTLAFRASYHGTRSDGVIRDIVSGEDGSVDKNAARLSMLWTPNERFEALLSVDYSDAERIVVGGPYTPGLQPLSDTPSPDAGQIFPETISLSRLNEENVTTDGAGLKLTWDFDNDITVTSISDYHSFDLDLVFDLDGTQADTALGAAFGLPPISIEFSRPDVTQYQFSQEFRVNGSTDELDWFIGASYFNEEVEDRTVISVLDVSGFLGGDINDTALTSGEADSIGIYGDITWSLNDRWSFTAGIRWSEDEKQWCSFGENNSNLLGVISTSGQTICSRETWSEVTPRVVVDFGLTDDVMLYASATKGYKGGGFNTPTMSTDSSNDLVLDLTGGFLGFFDQPPYLGDIGNVNPATEQVFFTGEAVSSFDPEIIDAYEIGMKGTFLNQQLQLNVAAFYNDYENLQVQSATVSGIVTENAAEAETKGAEIEFVYDINERFVLMGNYTFLDTEFKSGVFTGVDITGNQLPYAPDNAYSISAAYDLPIGDSSIRFFTNYNWTDDINHRTDNAPSLVQESYGLWNAKITYRPPSERWDASISVDNITDEEYATSLQDFGIGVGTSVFRALPRLWRVNVNTYFGG